MGFMKRFKDYIYEDDEYDDVEEDERYSLFDDRVVGDIHTIMKGEAVPDFTYDKERVTEEERKHCLKLYELACSFTDLDAATVLYVMCQTHMPIVMAAINNEFNELQETLAKYEEIKKG